VEGLVVWEWEGGLGLVLGGGWVLGRGDELGVFVEKLLIVCLCVWMGWKDGRMDGWMDLINSWDELDWEWFGCGDGFCLANGFG
jgi:hypothetical protein